MRNQRSDPRDCLRLQREVIRKNAEGRKESTRSEEGFRASDCAHVFRAPEDDGGGRCLGTRCSDPELQSAPIIETRSARGARRSSSRSVDLGTPRAVPYSGAIKSELDASSKLRRRDAGGAAKRLRERARTGGQKVRRQKEEVRNSAAGGTKRFLLNSSFLLGILSAAQNAAGRSEMCQPTV